MPVMQRSRSKVRRVRGGRSMAGDRAALEALEPRVLLSASEPTAAEQWMVEVINRARSGPAAEAARFPELGEAGVNEGPPSTPISNDPKQPLAIDPFLTDAAQRYTADLLAHGALDHFIGGTSPQQRAANAGYSGGLAGFENLAFTTRTPVDARSLGANHKLLFVDFIPGGFEVEGRGHRVNLMNPDLSEIGLGAADGRFGSRNATVVVQDFTIGRTYITGVAFTDAVDPDDFYTIGEGIGGLTIRATRRGGRAALEATTFGSGGYAIPVEPGTYDLVASGPALFQPLVREGVVVVDQNVKVDFIAGGVPPDLTVELVEEAVPAAVLAGDPSARGSASILLTNLGPGDLAESINIALVASLDGLFGNADDVSLASIPVAASRLGPGGTRTVRSSFGFPPTMAAGQYRLLARADSGDDVADTAETNNDDAGTATINVAPAFVDLAALSVAGTLASTAVAGDRGAVSVQVRNAGNVTVNAVVGIRIELVPQGGGQPVALATLIAKLNLRPGAAKAVRGPLLLGSEVPEGAYTLRASVDAADVLDESDETNNAAVGPAIAVRRGFGMLPGRARPARFALGQGGTIATLGLSGPGSGQVAIDPLSGAVDLLLSGTTIDSAVTIAARGGVLALRHVQVDGGLKSFGGRSVDLAGNFLVRDVALKIELHQVADNHLIEVRGVSADPKVALSVNLASAENLTLRSGAGIKKLEVGNWKDTDEEADLLEAPWLGSASSKGDLEADIVLTDPAVTLTLGSLAVAGTFRGAVVRSAGAVGAITVGRMENAAVYAGISDQVPDLALPGVQDDADFVRRTAIGKVTIKGVRGQAGTGSFVNSVLAAWLLGAVKLGTVALDNQGQPFGVAADRIGSIQGASLDGGSLTLRNLDDPAALDAFLAENEIELGDLRLDLVPAAL